MGNEMGCRCDDSFPRAAPVVRRVRSARIARERIAARGARHRMRARLVGRKAGKSCKVRYKEKYPIYSCRSKGKYLEQKGPGRMTYTWQRVEANETRSGGVKAEERVSHQRR